MKCFESQERWYVAVKVQVSYKSPYFEKWYGIFICIILFVALVILYLSLIIDESWTSFSRADETFNGKTKTLNDMQLGSTSATLLDKFVASKKGKFILGAKYVHRPKRVWNNSIILKIYKNNQNQRRKAMKQVKEDNEVLKMPEINNRRHSFCA